jgi:hypothetical protein
VPGQHPSLLRASVARVSPFFHAYEVECLGGLCRGGSSVEGSFSKTPSRLPCNLNNPTGMYSDSGWRLLLAWTWASESSQSTRPVCWCPPASL